MFTLITQAFGVRGEDGDLIIDPKLVPEQFDEKGIASVRTHLAGKELEIRFQNSDKLDVGDYRIGRILIDGKDVAFFKEESQARIERKLILNLPSKEIHEIMVDLVQ
jgi:cellobiose phosphorylase